MNLLFRQLYDVESGTFTYLLADEESHAGIIIDPVYEQLDRDLALIRELGINLSYCVETHCHADHVTAAWLLRNETDCRIAATAESNIEGLDLVLQHSTFYITIVVCCVDRLKSHVDVDVLIFKQVPLQSSITRLLPNCSS